MRIEERTPGARAPSGSIGPPACREKTSTSAHAARPTLGHTRRVGTCFAIGGVLMLALFGFAAWTRRGEGRVDRPNERTCATFRAPGEPTLVPGEPAGSALARRLHAALVARGTEPDAVSLGEHGWTFATPDAHVELVPTEDDAWAITILDPSSGGPGAIAMARAIDEALRTLEGVKNVRWHARESFDPFDLDGGHAHPTDDVTGS